MSNRKNIFSTTAKFELGKHNSYNLNLIDFFNTSNVLSMPINYYNEINQRSQSLSEKSVYEV